MYSYLPRLDSDYWRRRAENDRILREIMQEQAEEYIKMSRITDIKLMELYLKDVIK